ncbi:hypothetical protein RI367_006557 [Sorochytrium milnesiophthora]
MATAADYVSPEQFIIVSDDDTESEDDDDVAYVAPPNPNILRPADVVILEDSRDERAAGQSIPVAPPDSLQVLPPRLQPDACGNQNQVGVQSLPVTAPATATAVAPKRTLEIDLDEVRRTHIRPLFPEVVIGVDREVLDRHLATIEEQRKKIERLEHELARERLACSVAKADERRAVERRREAAEQRDKYKALLETGRAALEQREDLLMEHVESFVVNAPMLDRYIEGGGSFRVMAFARRQDVLYTSFSGRAAHAAHIVKVGLPDTLATDHIFVHTRAIKGLCASPHHDSQVISASLDGYGALVDTASNAVAAKCVQAYSSHQNMHTDAADRLELGGQGWTCRYHDTNPHVLMFGLHNNTVALFDIRKPNKAFQRLHEPAIMGQPSGRAVHSIAQLGNRLVTSSLYCGALWTQLSDLCDLDKNEAWYSNGIGAPWVTCGRRVNSMPEQEPTHGRQPSLEQVGGPSHAPASQPSPVRFTAHMYPNEQQCMAPEERPQCLSAFDVSGESVRCTGLEGVGNSFVAQLRDSANVCQYLYGTIDASTYAVQVRRVLGSHPSTLLSKFAMWRDPLANPNAQNEDKTYFAVGDETTKQIEIYRAGSRLDLIQTVDTYSELPLIDVKHTYYNGQSLLAGMTEKGHLYLYKAAST